MRGDEFHRGIAACAGGPASDLPSRVAARLAAAPACPVAHYLAGCAALERGRLAIGVRHMMVAHRGEPALESAALLVFAGLNWIGERQRPLLPVLLDTWVEFRRPEFDRRRRERALLDAFDAPVPDLARSAPLAQRLWRLPMAALRAEIRAALGRPDESLTPLLLATP